MDFGGSVTKQAGKEVGVGIATVTPGSSSSPQLLARPPNDPIRLGNRKVMEALMPSTRVSSLAQRKGRRAGADVERQRGGPAPGPAVCPQRDMLFAGPITLTVEVLGRLPPQGLQGHLGVGPLQDQPPAIQVGAVTQGIEGSL